MAVSNKALELVQESVNNLCKSIGIEAKVFTYADYSKNKADILKGHYLYICSPELNWLYNPDDYSHNIFTHADWGKEYHYVVVLNGTDEEEMASAASQILETQKQVGLIFLQTIELSVHPSK